MNTFSDCDCDCNGTLALYYRPISDPMANLSTTYLSDEYYPRRSLSWLRDVQVVRMEVIGKDCCWHIRHYNESFETPMHYEHIGSTFNATYTEEEHLQNQQTELEKDPGNLNIQLRYISCF